MRVLFLLLFVGGLALAVYAMLHGVERSPRRRPRKPSPFFNAPTAGAFFVAAGATGYLVAKHTSLSPLLNLILSLAVGGAAAGGMVGLLAGWALRRRDTHTEAEELQGQIARVTRAITTRARGEIYYILSGTPHRAQAESIEGVDIEPDTEVVIESIENGVARVERWSAVEQRL